MRLAIARALDRSIVLAASLCLAAKQYDLPSKLFWDQMTARAGYAVLGLVFVVGVFGVLTPFESASERGRVTRRAAMQRHILICFGQLLELGKRVKPPVAISDVGVHIWRRKRTLRHPLNGELLRIATYRLGATPMTRRFQPTKGVGVVGLCWKFNAEVGRDVSVLAAELDSEPKFNEYRAKNGADSVMGLTWEQFVRIKHRGAVFATPVRNGRSKFIGCISFDTEHGYDQLYSRKLWHELNSLSVMLAREGFQDV